MEMMKHIHLTCRTKIIKMKKIVLFAFTCISISLFADSNKEIDSKISAVNVFLNRAEINRTASTSVNSGMTDIVLSNLTQNIDPNSVQVSGKGDVVIMSVSHRLNHINKAKKSQKVKDLEERIKKLEEANVGCKI